MADGSCVSKAGLLVSSFHCQPCRVRDGRLDRRLVSPTACLQPSVHWVASVFPFCHPMYKRDSDDRHSGKTACHCLSVLWILGLALISFLFFSNARPRDREYFTAQEKEGRQSGEGHNLHLLHSLSHRPLAPQC